jgi:pSer/pThr/pTyr-binding forkhead associated (FHA) protein
MLLRPGERVVLGSGPNADLRIDDRAVSQRHCMLTVESGLLRVDDVGSKNGIFVGAVRVASAIVSDATAFVLGRTTIVVRPLGLVLKAGSWYLVHDGATAAEALCIDELRAIRITNRPFAAPPDFDLAEFWRSPSGSLAVLEPCQDDG